jgi:autotransporter strand-loop-strand O-heptosyltransferase
VLAFAEPYVCIAVQSTTQSKYWNNPDGWRVVVNFLRDAGYRVVCIDQKPTHGHGLIWNHIPNGAEDLTGDRTLEERYRYLKHAAFLSDYPAACHGSLGPPEQRSS